VVEQNDTTGSEGDSGCTPARVPARGNEWLAPCRAAWDVEPGYRCSACEQVTPELRRINTV